MRWQLILATVLCWAAGRLSSSAAEDPATWQSRGLIARMHFAGMQQIITDPNAAHVKEIAGLPETGAMRDYVFDKLAIAPYDFLKGHTAITNDEAQFIRPLLEDLIQAESCVEAGASTNRVPEFALAMRLKDERAGMWNSIVGRVASSWTGLRQTAIKEGGFTGWEIKKHEDPNTIRFFRAGDWIVFGWGQDDARLVSGMLDRIAKTRRPVDPLADAWLDTWVDWPAIETKHPLPLPFHLPSMRLEMQGRKEFVRSVLTMKFSAPLGLVLNPWRIPTNVIHNPISSFAAVRGVMPRLNQSAAAKKYNLPALPDQLFVWGISGIPWDTHFAAPVKDASNYLRQLAPGLTALINQFFETHQAVPELAGPARPFIFNAVWTNGEIQIPGMPFVVPYLGASRPPNDDCLVGGFIPGMVTREPLPQELFKEISVHPNLVYYGWELTGERLKEWTAIINLRQVIFMHIPSTGQTPPDKWIQALEPKLRNCATEVSLAGPDELVLVRNSTTGLTALELAELANWLDAPGFPLGGYREPAHWHSASSPPNGH